MTTVVLEYAKSGRSKCKSCKGTIEKAALRVGKVNEIGDRLMQSWFHVDCFSIPKKIR